MDLEGADLALSKLPVTGILVRGTPCVADVVVAADVIDPECSDGGYRPTGQFGWNICC